MSGVCEGNFCRSEQKKQYVTELSKIFFGFFADNYASKIQDARRVQRPPDSHHIIFLEH